MKPLTDLQKKSQELWDESFDKYVKSMTKRKIIYYFVLIIITSAVTILGYIIDQDLILHMAEKDGVYRSPLFIVVLLLDFVLLGALLWYRIISDFRHQQAFSVYAHEESDKSTPQCFRQSFPCHLHYSRCSCDPRLDPCQLCAGASA